MQIDTEPSDWRTPLLDYLVSGELPEDKTKARRLTRWAKSFVLLGNAKELYKRGASGVLQ